MKRITIIFIGLALALIIGNFVDAKVKKSSRSSGTSSNVVSIARSLANFDINVVLDNPQQVKSKTGLVIIYSKKIPASRANNMEERTHYIYGKNAKVTSSNGANITVKATGSNAFYYEINSFYNAQEEYGGTSCTFAFSNKADRDKFWQWLKKNFEPDNKGYKNGWYTVSTFGD